MGLVLKSEAERGGLMKKIDWQGDGVIRLKNGDLVYEDCVLPCDGEAETYHAGAGSARFHLDRKLLECNSRLSAPKKR